MGYGLWPWKEFELDPLSGRYTKRRLKSAPTSLAGYSGWGQELSIKGLGRVLCSVFLHEQDIFLRVGELQWRLFQPGLKIAQSEGWWRCEFSVTESGGKRTTFRYRRADPLLVIIDSTYDNLDFELANFPANLPSFAERKREELVALLSGKGG